MTILGRRRSQNRVHSSILLEPVLLPRTASAPLTLIELRRMAVVARVAHARAPRDYAGLDVAQAHRLLRDARPARTAETRKHNWEESMKIDEK